MKRTNEIVLLRKSASTNTLLAMEIQIKGLSLELKLKIKRPIFFFRHSYHSTLMTIPN